MEQKWDKLLKQGSVNLRIDATLLIDRYAIATFLERYSHCVSILESESQINDTLITSQTLASDNVSDCDLNKNYAEIEYFDDSFNWE